MRTICKAFDLRLELLGVYQRLVVALTLRTERLRQAGTLNMQYAQRMRTHTTFAYTLTHPQSAHPRTPTFTHSQIHTTLLDAVPAPHAVEEVCRLGAKHNEQRAAKVKHRRRNAGKEALSSGNGGTQLLQAAEDIRGGATDVWRVRVHLRSER